MNDPHCGASRRDLTLAAHGWGSREHGESYAADDGICLRPAGHGGPHEWTPEGEIMVEVPRESRREAGGGLVAWFVQVDPPGREPGVCWRAELHEPDRMWTQAFPFAMASLSDYRGVLGMVMDYIFVPDHFRRRGYATRLIAACRREWPGLVLTDAISPEGEALLDSLPDEVSEILRPRNL